MNADELRAFAAEHADAIKAVVDAAPPLSDEAIELLRACGLGRRRPTVEQVAS
jgi:hypothetical protein